MTHHLEGKFPDSGKGQYRNLCPGFVRAMSGKRTKRKRMPLINGRDEARPLFLEIWYGGSCSSDECRKGRPVPMAIGTGQER